MVSVLGFVIHGSHDDHQDRDHQQDRNDVDDRIDGRCVTDRRRHLILADDRDRNDDDHDDRDDHGKNKSYEFSNVKTYTFTPLLNISPLTTTIEGDHSDYQADDHHYNNHSKQRGILGGIPSKITDEARRDGYENAHQDDSDDPRQGRIYDIPQFVHDE